MMCNKKCCCGKHCHRRPNWEKEYLGKRLSECKYYRVCCERFIDAPKNDCDRGCDNGCDNDCDRGCDCDCD